jgi:hypothetical protein
MTFSRNLHPVIMHLSTIETLYRSYGIILNPRLSYEYFFWLYIDCSLGSCREEEPEIRGESQ